jgi:lytic murein transglycosylase
MTGMIRTVIVLLTMIAGLAAPAFADAGFDRFLESMRPRAQQLGVTRATFNAATRGLTPDYSLPDLAIPGRPEKAPPGQPEFVQTPGQYLRESSFNRLAARGQQLAAQYRATLARIERDFGVPGNVVLAIWARETDYGGYKLPHDGVRVLATQAYVGKRNAFFQNEFLYALKMLQDGTPRADMRSSWGGALGLTQFLPSEYYKYGVDFDGNGRADIFRSVPDALASAAKQLAGKGWQKGERWAYEVLTPKHGDCSIGTPDVTMPIADWIKRGYLPVLGRKLNAKEMALSASLLQPEGSYGPSFLTSKNYYVIKDYNFSDLYVLFVGHLSDRIAGAKSFVRPWSKGNQLKTKQVETMQQRLTALGLYKDKIDGKAGMLTRAALGHYQKANGLKVDCWPTAEALGHMQK